MRVRILPVLVTLALISTAVNAAEIYKDDNSSFKLGGRVEVRGNISDANADDFNDISRARIYLLGEKILSDDVTMRARYETEIKERTGAVDGSDTKFDTRYLYAGFKTQLGDIYYGHQDNATTYLTNFSDMAEYYSGYINELSVTTADRAKNTMRYAISANDVTFQASVNQNSDRKSDGYGAVVAYKLTDNVEFGIGYASADQETYDGGSEQTDTMAIVAAKYTTDNFWIGSTFQTGQISSTSVIEDDFTAYDLYLGYFFNNGSVINTTYTSFEADTISNYDMNFVAAEYAYYFQNIATYISYKHNLLDENDYSGAKWLAYENTQDEITFGLRYKF